MAFLEREGFERHTQYKEIHGGIQRACNLGSHGDWGLVAPGGEGLRG